MGNVFSHFGAKPKKVPEAPEANTGPVEINGVQVEYRVCSCCKPDKRGRVPASQARFFVYDESGKPIQMARTWESLCELRGWNS